MNPGPGGWAAILRFGSAVKEIAGSDEMTTNNVMEFKAIVEAVKALKEPCSVLIRSDSECAIVWCRPDYMKKHHKNGVRRPHVLTLSLEWGAVSTKHKVNFEWVKGHSGDPDNERCDALAQEQSSKPF